MPKYNFKCSDCGYNIQKNMQMSELKSFDKTCLDCGSQMAQHIPSFSSKVRVSKEEMIDNAKAEAKKLADKVRAGDQKLISQIYGEK